MASSLVAASSIFSRLRISGSSEGRVGGYDCRYVSEVPDALLCLICTFPARDPQQIDCCGKIFCKTCLDKQKTNYQSACPNCRSERWSGFPDRRGERDIMSLKVKCSNCDCCPWEGELRQLEKHVEQCSRETVPCMYSELGCKANLLKAKAEEHYSKVNHLTMAMQRIRLLNNRIEKLEQEVGKRIPPIVFKMEDIEYHKENEIDWDSPPFYSHAKGYKFYLKVESDDDTTSVYVCLMHGEFDDNLVWPFRGVILFEILNQESDSDHKEGMARFMERKTSLKNRKVPAIEGKNTIGWGMDNFLSEDEEDDYVVDDCMYLRVSSITVQDMNKPWLI